MGQATNPVSFLEALSREPYQYDFYQVMRRLECDHAEMPRWGMALRPRDEPVRLGQDPELSFAPASLASFTAGENGRRARLGVRLFGLLGPNGPLPLHLTEYARDRLRHAGDRTFARFLDLLSHRFVAFFYRAWAQSQPTVAADRPGEDRFHTFIGALIGIAPAAFR
ncbi:MAG: type VI secretion system baseplate subunit TssG, partial [Gammaproteobacteria bacterium]|nr:type VI secretion system baseplate subunit TssG [Gammaproteobacteria bacterium]